MDIYIILALSLLLPIIIIIGITVLLIEDIKFFKKLEKDIIEIDNTFLIPKEQGILFVTSKGELSYTPEGPNPQIWEDAVVKMNTIYYLSGIWIEEVGLR